MKEIKIKEDGKTVYQITTETGKFYEVERHTPSVDRFGNGGNLKRWQLYDKQLGQTTKFLRTKSDAMNLIKQRESI